MALLRSTRQPRARRGLWSELDRRDDAFANITPNWFASVMGTGIIGVAAFTLPVHIPGLHTFGLGTWVLAAVMLVVLLAATATHWRRFPDTARQHHLDPVMGHFYGAPAMAMLVVGAGTLLLGRDLLGVGPAVGVDWVLWFAGTATGLVTTVAIPYLQFTRHHVGSGDIFAGWLMPVVPPMVSASTGALLVQHAPAGQARLTMLMACYAMFGVGLLLSIVIVTLYWYRLAVHGVGEARMAPTLWIALGPFGQSITAVNLLGTAATTALPRYARAFRAFGVVYGAPMWGVAMLFGALAITITVRAAREGLPFSLTWWSFTFPVGTCVTGSTELFLTTHAQLFRGAAVVIYAGLLCAWATVLTRTVRGTFRGDLLRPAPR